MSETDQKKADERLEAAMTESGARDPREFYRTQLKELRAESPSGYERAVEHYRTELVPGIAGGDEPLAAWTEYGRVLASLRAEGRTVSIDASGLSEPYAKPAAHDALVLHLPDDKKRKALVVGLPSELTDAQRATFDWLVTGKLKLRDAG